MQCGCTVNDENTAYFRVKGWVRFKIGAIAPSHRLKSGSVEVRSLKDGLRRPFVLEGVGPPSAQSAPRA